MEAVGGRALLHAPPPLHHLDGFRHHTHRGGERDQEQQVCRRITDRSERQRLEKFHKVSFCHRTYMTLTCCTDAFV